MAALALLMYGRLGNQIQNERDPRSGTVIPVPHIPYTMDEFWRSGIGIVTPHRAQQALIAAKLQQVFGPLGASNQLIRDAVDTVERFQGQQRAPKTSLSRFAIFSLSSLRSRNVELRNICTSVASCAMATPSSGPAFKLSSVVLPLVPGKKSMSLILFRVCPDQPSRIITLFGG